MDTKQLELKPPDELRYGESGCRVGWKVWRAVDCVSATGSASVTEFQAAVWSKPPKRGAMRTLLSRVNNLLEGLGCPRRLLLEKETITLA